MTSSATCDQHELAAWTIARICTQGVQHGCLPQRNCCAECPSLTMPDSKRSHLQHSINAQPSGLAAEAAEEAAAEPGAADPQLVELLVKNEIARRVTQMCVLAR